MRIGINTRFLLSSKMEGFGWYTFEIAKRLVLNHPEHEFVFFFDRAMTRNLSLRKTLHPLLFRRRLDILYSLFIGLNLH